MITINQLKIALQIPCGAEKNAKIRLDSPEILRKKTAKMWVFRLYLGVYRFSKLQKKANFS